MFIIKNSQFVDPNINIYYRFLTDSTILPELHSHDFWEFFVVLEGKIIHNLNNKIMVLEKDTILLIRPKDCHSFELIENAKGEYLNFTLTEEHMYQICNFLDFNIHNLLNFENNLAYIFYRNDFTPILDKLHSLIVRDEIDSVKAKELKIIAMEFAFFFIKVFCYDLKNSEMPLWFKTLLLDMNNPENIENGIYAIAKKTGYNEKIVSKMFRRFFDTTANAYLTNMRMVYAENLLSNTDKDILAISQMVGYDSLSHFIKIFKKYYDLPPSSYRKNKYKHI